MKKLTVFLVGLVLCFSVFARPGSFSSGSRGGSSSPSRGSFSSAPASRPSPSIAPSRTVTTTTTTRSYSSHVRTGGMYGGYGYGYHYNNGLLTGMIIGGMMHPYGTMMYMGPGMYYNNAFLYPNGQVVNSQGIVVGMYVNGMFTPVNNGTMVAQPVPADAYEQNQAQMQPQAQQQAPTPVIIQNNSNDYKEIITMCGLIFAILIVLFIFVSAV